MHVLRNHPEVSALGCIWKQRLDVQNAESDADRGDHMAIVRRTQLSAASQSVNISQKVYMPMTQYLCCQQSSIGQESRITSAAISSRRIWGIWAVNLYLSMKRLHPTELCLKGENLTSLYKSAAMNIHSFRELKYTIGLSCLHGKKTDFLLQEVFARLILYNYASLIARKIPVPQEKQINFSVAILVCKQFLKGKIRPAQIFGILAKHLSPIRPGRQYKRYQNPVSAVAFQYRFS